ncbi:MAG: hypothetical protein NZ733_01460 [Aigarchaeota archaeon]|nr:hypothetical protein [Aigarchaeota archaeon]
MTERDEHWEVIYVRRDTHNMLKRQALERSVTMRELADRILYAALSDRDSLERLLRRYA